MPDQESLYLKPLILLDLDGVVNGKRYRDSLPDPIEDPSDCFCKERVARLNDVIKATGAKVVLTSDWRRVHPVKRIDTWLKMRGFKGEIIGETPVRNYRFQEIRAWLEEHRVGLFQVVVFEDQHHFPADIEARTVRTQYLGPDAGLQPRHVQRALDLFASYKERASILA